MKNIIYLVSLVLVFSSCTKKDSLFYEEPDALQFNAGNNFKTEYNFATQFDPKSPVWDPYFFGDSLTHDTLSFRVDLLGAPSSEDRQYYLKTVNLKGQDSDIAPDIEFFNPYTLKANQIRDTIKLVIRRPQTRGIFSTGVTFDFEKMKGSFGRGVEELLEMEFEIADRYEQPEGWNVDYFGEYSEEKYAFFITVLHTEYVSWMDWMFESYRQTLKERLKQFNDEHPDNPKDFTFPG